MQRSNDRRPWRRAAVALALLTPLYSLAGCSGSGDATPPGGGADGPTVNGADMGPGTGPSLVVAPATTSGDFVRPFDSVPSTDGSTFYFVATNGAGAPAIFSVPARGGAAVRLASGAPLSSPFGIAISTDGKTLYVADPGAGAADSAAATDPDAPGAVYTLPVGGGTPALLAGTAGYSPRGLDVVLEGKADAVYFTGLDPADGSPGLFKVGAAGGGTTVVSKGAPLSEPSGVAVAASGIAYVTDHLGSGGARGALFQVSAGSASKLVGGLRFGFPAGVALTRDEKSVLVSGIDDASRLDVVYLVDLASHKVSSTSQGVGSNTDAGGLHRARGADVLSWCGTTAGSGGGLVYTVTTK